MTKAPFEKLTIATLHASDIGRSVRFTYRNGLHEYGVVSSWNDFWVFVRFGLGTTAAACDPEQLEWNSK